MNITINRIPPRVAKEIKKLSPRLSAYARTALAEKLARDGHAELANLITPKVPAP